MFFKSILLCEKLDCYNELIIYGTGDYAKQIYPYLVKYGLKDKIICFTQTKTEKDKKIDGISVLDINKLIYDKKKCAVLIAVSELYVDEIRQILLKYGYMNVFSLVDYQVYYKWLEKDYVRLTGFQEYCEYVADWYVTNEVGDLNHNIVLQQLLESGDTAYRSRKDINLIVMVCGHLSARTTKIAGALKRKNFNIIMLSYFGEANPWCKNEMRKLGIHDQRCHCVAEMLYYAIQYNPLVYFVEPHWGDCLWAEIILKNKRYLGKMVISLYDVMNDGYVGIEEEKLRTERYSLEHADGIVWRWFSKDSLEKKGFCFQGKSIQFLDYCVGIGNNAIAYDKKLPILRLCAIAGYGDEYVEERPYEDEYLDWARVGEILEKIGERSDCLFHFFAGALSDDNVNRCKQYEKLYKNFKFFLGTRHDEMLQRLQSYDFGCELYTDRKMAEDDIPVGRYYGSIFINSVCNKYFDFISAGLPIIITHPLKICEYFSTYGFVVKMNLSNLNIDYLIQNRAFYKDKVRRAKEELDIDNQIIRLIDFFKNV